MRLLPAVLFAALALTACGTTPRSPSPDPTHESVGGIQPQSVPLARLEPGSGVYYGVNLDWQNDTPVNYAARLGRTPSVYVRFFNFPFGTAELNQLDSFMNQVASQGGQALLTLEPHGGLNKINNNVANDLARRLAVYNQRGISVFVRFAHEMNGSWYPWGQQPSSYKRAFTLLANAVHARAPKTAMLWAPNYGGGYPFNGGRYAARPGTTEFAALDTDRDGRLTMSDDMYAPYYPGDGAVDWVGMTIYHWGSSYPWRENEIPEPGKFQNQITGIYNGLNGDDRAVPDFYQNYAVNKSKPIAIPETAAFYNTQYQVPGEPTETEIKQAWWQQVFNTSLNNNYPKIKMINWFEYKKAESEVGYEEVDWRVTTPVNLTGFQQNLPSYLIYGTR